jgi:hypothetical protein
MSGAQQMRAIDKRLGGKEGQGGGRDLDDPPARRPSKAAVATWSPVSLRYGASSAPSGKSS